MCSHPWNVNLQFVRVRDVKSPVGFKTILNNVNGQFDWGKLGVIMGASESGRSSLLHFLGGDTGTGSQVQGTLLIDGVAPDPKVPLWLRCGLVEARDEHFKDLTVKDIVTYALKLRCDTILANDVVEESIAKTLDILHLEKYVMLLFPFNSFLRWLF